MLDKLCRLKVSTKGVETSVQSASQIVIYRFEGRSEGVHNPPYSKDVISQLPIGNTL
jgi:hypothetical protein